MDEIQQLLKSVDERLKGVDRKLDQLLGETKLSDVIEKNFYSCEEVADLTQRHGTKKAKAFTVRLACSDGRIPDAEKLESGHWRIPKSAVLRILSDGIPPERRSHTSRRMAG